MTSSLTICQSLFSIHDVTKSRHTRDLASFYSLRLPTAGKLHPHCCFRESYEFITLIFVWKSENSHSRQYPSRFEPDTSRIRMQRDIFDTISGWNIIITFVSSEKIKCKVIINSDDETFGNGIC
jgi:hypothetical protein